MIIDSRKLIVLGNLLVKLTTDSVKLESSNICIVHYQDDVGQSRSFNLEWNSDRNNWEAF